MTSRLSVASATGTGVVPFRTTNDADSNAVAAHTLAVEVAGVATPVSAAVPVPVSSPAVGVVCINRGGVIATGGTAQQAAAANASRQAFIIKNPATATEPLYFDVVGTATTASFPLEPGASFSWPAGTICIGAISVLAATTGHAFAMVECQ